MGESFRGALKLAGIFGMLFIAVAFFGSIIGVLMSELSLTRFVSYFLKTLFHPVSFFLYFIFMVLPLVWAGIYDLRAKKKNIGKIGIEAEKGSESL